MIDKIATYDVKVQILYDYFSQTPFSPPSLFVLQAITPQTIIWLQSLPFPRHSRIIFPYIPPLNARKEFEIVPQGKPFHGRSKLTDDFHRFPTEPKPSFEYSLYVPPHRSKPNLSFPSLKPRDDITKGREKGIGVVEREREHRERHQPPQKWWNPLRTTFYEF